MPPVGSVFEVFSFLFLSSKLVSQVLCLAQLKIYLHNSFQDLFYIEYLKIKKFSKPRITIKILNNIKFVYKSEWHIIATVNKPESGPGWLIFHALPLNSVQHITLPCILTVLTLITDSIVPSTDKEIHYYLFLIPILPVDNFFFSNLFS